MSAALAVLLAVLKAAGVVLLVLLGLLCLALLTPAGLAVCWNPGAWTLHLRFGPLRVLLYPRPAKAKKATRKTGAKPRPEPQDNKAKPPDPGQTAQKSTPGGLVENLRKKAADTMETFEDDPLQALLDLWGLANQIREPLLRAVHIRRLNVFWTVTGQDAADTALCYGRRIALCNQILALAQGKMDICAEQLRLEPDFTGKLAGKRHFSCQITARPFIMLIIGLKLVRQGHRGPAMA